MRRGLWIFGSILALLTILPLAIYGSFPIWGATVLKDHLTKRGLSNLSIELGYPTQRSLEIKNLVFTKDLPGESLTLTCRNVILTYHLSELIHGTVDHIVISDVAVEANPKPPGNAKDSLSPISPLTVKALFVPVPVLPFQQLVFEQVSVHRPQNPERFRQLQLSGSLSNEKGTVSGSFTMEGPHFPLYKLNISGTPTGDIHILLQSLRPKPTMVVRVKTSISQSEKKAHLQGTFTTDLKNLSSFASLLWPIDTDLQHLTGIMTVDWRASFPKHVLVDAEMTKHVESLKGSMELHMTLPQWKSLGTDISATLKGEFGFTNDLLTWTLWEQSHAEALVNLAAIDLPEQARSFLPPTYHRLLVDLPQTVIGQVKTTTESPELTLTGEVRTQFRIKELPLNIELSLTELAGTLPLDFTGQGNFRLSGTLPKVTHQHTSIQQTSFDFSGKASLTRESLQLALRPGASFEAISFQREALSIPRLKLDLQEPFSVTYQLHNHGWESGPTRMHFRIPHFAWKDIDLSSDGGKLYIESVEGQATNWKTKGEVIVLGLGTTIKIKDFTLPNTNWKVKFSGDPSAIHLQFLCQTSDKVVSLQGRSFVDLPGQTGWGQIKSASLTFGPTSFLLSNFLHPWPYPFDITAGEVSAFAHISWEPDSKSDTPRLRMKTAEATIDLQHLTGHYEKIIFTGLNTTVTLAGLNPWSMPETSKLTLKEIQSGLSATDIAMDFKFSQNPSSPIPLLDVRDLTVSMLGGRITTRSFLFDESRGENSLTLHIQDLDLGEVLKLEQQEDLQGTGILDGTLPTTVTKTGVEVRQGKIEARQPGGVIRFQPSEGSAQSLSQANANMNIILQALSNFHYDELSIGLDYQADGTLNLQTTLKGRNPDFKKGQRLHFNLNIEENLPALLKSLQVTRRIEEEIERIVQ